MAATPVRETSTRPSGRISVDEAVDLGRRAGDLEHEAGMGRCPRARARKASAMRSAFAALLAGARHFHQRHFALDAAPSARSSW